MCGRSVRLTIPGPRACSGPRKSVEEAKEKEERRRLLRKESQFSRTERV